MQRREFVDWARGFAVIAMVLWHTADGWLTAEARAGQVWVLLRFVGGLAAPSFLFLAGAGLALAARDDAPARASSTSDGPTRAGTIAASTAPARYGPRIARGLEILLFGYVLRYQTWMIDAAAIRQLGLLRAWLPLGAGYALLLLAIHALKTGRGRAGRFALVGGLAACAGLAQVPWLAPGRLLRLLQVDVLQAIGASLVLLTLGERWFRLLRRPGLALGLGGVIALATDLCWSNLPGPLPAPIAAYFGRFPTAPGQPPSALFPLLPWCAYACFGAAFGSRLRAGAREGNDEDDRLLAYAGLAGALLALVTSEAHGFIQSVMAAQPWSVHPLRVAFRTGVVLVVLLVGWLWASGSRGRVLIAYGRASLRIYWAHLLVAYGVLGALWYKRLGVGEWGARVVLVLAFMWLFSQLKMRAPVALPNHEASNGPAPVPMPPRRGRLP